MINRIASLKTMVIAAAALALLGGAFWGGWTWAGDRAEQRGEHLAVWYEYEKFKADRYQEYYWENCGDCVAEFPNLHHGPADFVAEGRLAWQEISPLDLDTVMHLDDFNAEAN